MSICTTSGYVLDTIGPYAADASSNDAKLIEDIIEKEEELMAFVKSTI
mgnify:CR=1 FL=1